MQSYTFDRFLRAPKGFVAPYVTPEYFELFPKKLT